MYDQLTAALVAHTPWNEQEERDRAVMLSVLRESENCFSRENQLCHFTASSWITDSRRRQVLMAHHRLYHAWAWTGGHADGETDLLAVALREAEEETGIHASPVTERIFSRKSSPWMDMKSMRITCPLICT